MPSQKTISSTLTVSTLDEGVTYEIQTTVDSVTIPSNVDTTTLTATASFYKKEGDNDKVAYNAYYAVYMRAGTSYSRIRYGTGTSCSMNASNISTIYDAIVVYIFSSSYTSNAPENVPYIAKKEIKVVKNGDNGSNSVRIDINNQADLIACDADGKVLYNRTITTIAKIYDGAAVAPAVDSVTNPVLNVTRGGSTVNVASRGAYSSGVVIQFSFQEGDILSNVSSSVDITITYHSVNYTATFSLTRTDSTAIYQLLPSMLEIPFSVDSSNVYQPEYQRIDCGYTKTDANNTQSFAGNVKNNTCKPTAPYNILFRYQNADRTYTDGWNWMKDQPDVGSGTRYIQVGRDTAYIAIEFILTSADSGRDVSDSNIIDRETVPIIKSGKKGDTGAKGDKGDNGADGVSATVTPSSISVQCNTSGAVKTSVSQNLSFGLKVGAQSCSGVTAVQKSGTTLPTGVTLTTSSGKVTSITIGTTATASGLAAGVTFTVSGTHNSVGYSSECTLALIGALQGQTGQGERGKTGRFYSSAGEFDKNNNTDTFSVSDIQVPFFSHGTNEVSGLPNCHLFDYDTNGSYTMYRMWQISGGGNWNAGDWNNDPWKTMWNDQKYLITEAQFTKYGQLASFVFNGDWQLSTNGTIDGQPYNTPSWDNPATIDGVPAYLCFESSDPLGDGVTIGENISVSTSNTSKSITVSNKGYKVIKVVVNTIGSGTLTISVSSTGMTTKTKTISSVGTYYIVVNTDTTTSSTITITAKKSSGTGNISLYKTSYAPNYCVDGRTGSTYQNKTYVRGTVYATNLFHNVCYWWGVSSIYGGGEPYEKGDYEYQTSGSADVIDIMQQQGDNWSWTNVTNNNTLLLPSPSLYEGKMVTIYCRVIKCSGQINISCVETNKMVTRWTNNNGKLEPSSQSGSKVDSISLQWAYYVKASRLGSATGEWSGTTNVDIPDVLHIPQYVFVAQSGYWFQIK